MENNLEQQKEKTLKERIITNLAILVIFFGLMDPIDIELGRAIWIIIIVSAILVAVYQHYFNKIKDKINKVKEYFNDLREDIKFIKEKVKEDKNEQ